MFALAVFAVTSGGQASQETEQRMACRLAESLPVFFVENRGVESQEIRYYVRHDRGALLFADDRVVIRRFGSETETVSLTFPGAKTGLRVGARAPRVTRVHYFEGRPERWRTDVPTFGEVIYRDVWPGIDLVFRAARNRVKYAFHVRAGVDPSVVRMEYVGADHLRVASDGSIEIAVGSERITDDAPVAYQLHESGRAPVAVSFVQEGRSTVRFRLGAYDLERDLVIDPAVLTFCGYAGTGVIGLYGIAVDQVGGVYLVGDTLVKLPTDTDATLIKVHPSGKSIEYVAHIRGSGGEGARDVFVDAQGYIYIVGATDSDEKSFPVKTGPDLTYNNGTAWGGDAFICKLTPNAKSIVYCGYIGGSSLDIIYALDVDKTGKAWVTGETMSPNFPLKGGPQLVQPGMNDGFVCCVAADGKALLVAGYLGGKYFDQPWDIAVDPKGDAYVTGRTQSSHKTFPVKVGPDLTYNYHIPGLSMDAFVAKIGGTKGQIQYCGYIGGSGFDWGQAIAVDSSGRAYVGGGTQSDEKSFPVKIGPYLKGTVGFLSKLNATGTGFEYSGIVPGGQCTGVVVDSSGSAYIAGYAGGSLPVLGGPSAVHAGGGTDAFVAKVLPSGVGFKFAGFIGGSGGEQARALAVDGQGSMYLCGFTASTEATFPVKVGPGLAYNGTAIDYGQWVAKVAETALVGAGSPQIGGTIQWSLTATGDAGNVYVLGTSLGAGPISVDQRVVGLSPDGLLAASLGGGLPAVFVGYSGIIDAKGTGIAALQIPNLKLLIGYRLHTAFVTLDPQAPSGINSISNTVMITVR